MKTTIRFAATVLVLLALPGWAVSCLWDRDTLQQERARFPTALELMTGKFLRHSPEFYAWRVQDRSKKVASSAATAADYDDLAVAYQKIGRPEEALETLAQKEARFPGLYETYSNRGTFHILNGDFEKGLPDIDRALAINPDAHFGREKYQKWLVEYALSRRIDGKLVFPLSIKMAERKEDSFVHYLETQIRKDKMSYGGSDIRAAIQAMLGMMKFANYRNPLLLEALGDLFSTGTEGIPLTRLAARCYLLASEEMDDAPAKLEFVHLAEKMEWRIKSSTDLFWAEFPSERRDAGEWYDALRQRELAWIRDAADPEAEFDRLYTEEPSVVSTTSPPKRDTTADTIKTGLVVLCSVAAVVMFWLIATQILRGRRKGQAGPSGPPLTSG